MKACVECKGALKSASLEHELLVGEYRIAVTIPVQRCEGCGESYIDGPVLERAELLVSSQLLTMGIATGAAFKFMRKALGIRAVDLAELLNVDAATVSRWENDKVPVDRAALATLAAAASERLEGHETTLDRLRRVREGKRPAAALRVKFSRGS